MAHATIRATLIPEVVKLICKSENVDENTALDMFYTSVTAENLYDDETGLYGQSALFIYSMFKEEIS